MTRFDLNSIVNSWTNTSSSFVNDIIISALFFAHFISYHSTHARVYVAVARMLAGASCV